MSNHNLAVDIGGMHCGACVRRVRASLQSVTGIQVEHVEVGRAEITVHGDAAEDRVRSAIERAGFTVVSVAHR